ncbi:Hemerythrin HHE cation binding domain-containing protein [Oceanobacillus limi]|uniref:Hemerythrin HHE cation binding domain-containing protein n=1 Tax=Oceanobacillus limi TaxID=930131 RepID=A0A1H9XZS7_9BACI|nr:hemerythrin domain-containing protein [Oceanobacillus limi]SES61851.1 Hemerythrin HHE cation binding domain-containing protein [Oceanobacillus limi]
MAKRKGIIRHESLKPLSRHHMVGLHIALKLKRAGTEESRLTLEEIMQDVTDFWNPNGQNHFREEEEILLPAYAQYASVEQSEIIEMLLEHVQIRSQMTRLLEAEEYDIPSMQELGVLLESHIRKEERVIFPMIEKALPEEKLKELTPYLHEG